jgi:hypothetical protein
VKKVEFLAIGNGFRRPPCGSETSLFNALARSYTL